MQSLTMFFNALFTSVPAKIGRNVYGKSYCIRIRARCSQRKKPKGTPEGEGLYLTVYPESSPNKDSILLTIILL